MITCTHCCNNITLKKVCICFESNKCTGDIFNTTFLCLRQIFPGKQCVYVFICGYIEQVFSQSSTWQYSQINPRIPFLWNKDQTLLLNAYLRLSASVVSLQGLLVDLLSIVSCSTQLQMLKKKHQEMLTFVWIISNLESWIMKKQIYGAEIMSRSLTKSKQGLKGMFLFSRSGVCMSYAILVNVKMSSMTCDLISWSLCCRWKSTSGLCQRWCNNKQSIWW